MRLKIIAPLEAWVCQAQTWHDRGHCLKLGTTATRAEAVEWANQTNYMQGTDLERADGSTLAPEIQS